MQTDAKLCVRQSTLATFADMSDTERRGKKLMTLHVRLGERVLVDLREIAEEQGRAISNLAAHVITRWVADQKKGKRELD
jgi:hypothetical protein